jgi:hypothetical protein
VKLPAPSLQTHLVTAAPSARRCAAAGLAALVFAAGAQATEFGGGHYVNGAEDFMAGALPPPGTYFINYLAYYSADRFNDKNGGKQFADFDLNVVGNNLRFVHVTNHKVLGANWGMQLFVPLMYQDVERRIASGFPEESDETFGLYDIIIDPILLGWHSKNWHFVAGLDIYVPIGKYDEPDPGELVANPGRNYWTFEPAVAFTYLSDGGFEVSAKFMYDFNTENEDTDYKSGQEFHLDYTVGYHTGPWSLGVGGYYYKQTTSDSGRGVPDFLGDFKGQAIAVGPQVKYDYRNMSFTLKYQTETEVENRPEGDILWAKFLYAF